MLTEKAKTRLTRLIKFMASLPASANKHFDMRSYVDHQGDHEHAKRGASVTGTLLNKCGTTACAAGWAATIPAFRKAGFRVLADPMEIGGGKPIYRGATSGDALMKFFNVDSDQMGDLFGADLTRLKTPKAWAKHARKLLKRWSAA